MNEPTQQPAPGAETISSPPVGFVGRRARRPERRQRSHERPKRGGVSFKDFYQPLPLWLWVTTGALMALGMLSKNPLLTPAAILMLPLLSSLLWFKGEPPVLLFASAMQWLQATVAIFYTNYYNVSLSEAAGYPEFVSATWLSMLGILVLALGMRLALLGRQEQVAQYANAESRQLVPGKIFGLYLVAFLVMSILEKLASMAPSLSQPILALRSIKWVVVFLLVYAVLKRRQGYGLMLTCVIMELLVGFLGFFSGFRSIFMILLTVLPTAGYAFRGWRVVQVSVLAVMMVSFGIVWTVIKVDYREFLNQGSGQQEITVSVTDRANKLRELVGGLTEDTFSKGVETMVMRVNYVNYFALCLMNVPANLPYEHGKLWRDAVTRVFMPRFLFPDKSAIDDSERTSYYTGVYVAGAEQGTSISIGYMGESYIDFGRVGMFAPILLLGLFYGFIYRYFVHYPHTVMGFAMATAILLFGAYQLEMSNVKLVGGNVMSFLVLALFCKICGGWLQSAITQNKPAGGRHHIRSGEKNDQG